MIEYNYKINKTYLEISQCGKEIIMKLIQVKIMNFEIMCFGLDNFNEIVHKEYTKTYAEARAFEMAEQDNYSCISITPMNEKAEHEMACVQCGGKYGQEACKTCRHR